MTRIRYHFDFLEEAANDAVLASNRARRGVRRRMLAALNEGDADTFAHLALGIDEPAGNYGAAERANGAKILAFNTRAEERVMELALRFQDEPDIDVPQAIREASLAHCRVGIGSELSSMIRPIDLWVCNSRTLWTQLLFQHNDLDRANEALELYLESDSDSEFYWPTWAGLHAELGRFMKRLLAKATTAPHLTTPKSADLLWADAICNTLYNKYTDA